MSNYDIEMLRRKVDHCRVYLGEAKDYIVTHKDVPGTCIQKQHDDIVDVYSTVMSMYDYINSVSEEEQRQGTSSQVSGVFAVSS